MSLDFTFDNGATAIGDVSLPFQVSGLFFVDWGDGVTDTGLTHTYTATSATAKVQLTGGTITGFSVSIISSDWTGVDKLTELANNTGDDNWGWGTGSINLESAFRGATKLTSVPSTIPVGTVNIPYIFSGASVFNGDISTWDTSNVTNMQSVFNNVPVFNQDISNWNTSNVTNVSFMFQNDTAFDQNIRGWDTTNVTTYTNMFNGASNMLSTYNGVTGFGTTPTSAFFNQVPSLDFTFDNDGSAIGQVSLPFQGSGTFSVDWGDGVTDNSLVHTYSASTATAKVTLSGGTITGFGSYQWSGHQLLTKLENNTGDDNWGFGTGSISFNLAFFGASKLTSVPSTIPVGTNNMSNMFTAASAFNGDISGWDTSNVTNMTGMLSDMSAFNKDISSWNTSNVRNMAFMFNNATAFNNGDSGNNGANPLKWNTSNVTDMNNMFYAAPVFNQDISTWVTSNVTDMREAFSIARVFNQDISSWDTSNVTDMKYMFSDMSAFNKDISSWNTSNVTDMQYMFNNATAFNNGDSGNNGANPLTWNTSNVIDMNFMFRGASAFNQNIRGWDTTNVTTYNNMFQSATAMISTYTGVTGFGTSPNYTPTSAFFNQVPSLDFTFDNGATAIGDVSLPFQGSGTFSVDWGDGVTDTSLTHTYSATSATAKVQLTGGTVTGFGIYNWSGAAVLTSVANNTGNDNWGFGTGAISFNLAFSLASKLTSVPSTIPVGTNNMISMFDNASAFNGDISGWDTSNVTTMEFMFSSARAFNSGGQPLTWNTSNVTNMQYMFTAASVFDQDISGWNTSNVTNMGLMFNSASAFNGDISTWDTSNVTDMAEMFRIAAAFNGDISGWDTSNVTNMLYMFADASAFNGDISTWDTSNVNNMQYMFNNASVFDQNIRFWDTLNVTTYNNMFLGAQAMISTYTGVTGFGDTPTSAFFNFTPTLDFTFDNGATAIGTVSLPYQGSGIAVSVDWGDGVTDTSLTHTYSATSATAKVQRTGGTITGFGDMNWGGVAVLTSVANNAGDDNWGWGTGAINLLFAFTQASKLTSVPSTIPVGTNNMSNMFYLASVFNQDISGWDTSNVTDMQYMFYNALAFDQNISSWDTSNVTSMLYMFSSAVAFNIGGQSLTWNTSNVINMAAMFYGASVFNGDISTWDTSNVINMASMFRDASVFDVNIRNWDTLNVSNYENMFLGAQAMISTYTGVTGFGDTPTSAFFNFTPTLDFTFDNGATAIGAVSLPYQGSGIAVSVDWGDGVTDTSLTHTYTATNATAKVRLTGGTITGFGGADWPGVAVLTSVANNTGDDNWGWGTGDIDLLYAFRMASQLTSVPNTIPVGTTRTYQMFDSASAFNGDISGWDTSNVTNIYGMFYGASAFNNGGQPLTWNTSNVTDMQYLFYGASVFNGDISTWDTSNVTTMRYMFNAASAFNNGGQPLTWNTSNVINVDFMFRSASAFNVDISSWDTSNVRNMGYLFLQASAFNNGGQPLTWNTSNVTNMYGMFYFAYAFNQNISSWDTSNVTDMGYLFRYASAFNGDISSWNTSNVTNMFSMFAGAYTFNQNISTKVINEGLSNEYIAWDVSKVQNMGSMLWVQDYQNDVGNWNNGEAPTLSNNPLYWDTSNVTSMNSIFREQRRFNQKCSTEEVTLGTTNPITYIAWDVSKVQDMLRTFAYGESFNNGQPAGESTQPLYWDTSNATTMEYMFGIYNSLYSTGSYNQPMVSESRTIGSTTYTTWNTSNVNSMKTMFQYSKLFNQDIGSWDTSNVNDMRYMFNGASVFNGDISSWNTSNVLYMGIMFNRASAFNGDISSWNTSNVNTLASMFSEASVFDQDISSWNTSNVLYMDRMFDNASAFNNGGQPLTWTTSNVINVDYMFSNAVAFNQPSIGDWDFTNVAGAGIQFFITLSGMDPDTYSLFIQKLAANTTLQDNLIHGVTGEIRFDDAATNAAWETLTRPVVDGGKNMLIYDGGSFSQQEIEDAMGTPPEPELFLMKPEFNETTAKILTPTAAVDDSEALTTSPGTPLDVIRNFKYPSGYKININGSVSSNYVPFTPTNVEIWVDAGDLNTPPYYNFYTDSQGTTPFSGAFNESNTYTFKRLSEATTHPFYISDTGAGNPPSNKINVSGDGNFQNGITGSQVLSLSFNQAFIAQEDSLTYYCTSHSNMNGTWTDISGQDYLQIFAVQYTSTSSTQIKIYDSMDASLNTFPVTSEYNEIRVHQVQHTFGTGIHLLLSSTEFLQLSDWRAEGVTASELKAIGYSAGVLRYAGYSCSELQDAGYSQEQVTALGCTFPPPTPPTPPSGPPGPVASSRKNVRGLLPSKYGNSAVVTLMTKPLKTSFPMFRKYL